MANPSLQIGNDNWAIKEDNLLGYSTAGTRFVPQPITMTRETLGTRVNPSGLVEDVALLGSEELTDGDFPTGTTAWEEGTGWSLGDGYVESDGTNAPLDQYNVLEIGKQYKVVITVTGMTASPLSVRLGTSSSNQVLSITSDGTYTAYGEAGSTTFRLRSAGFNGKVTNVSVKEATIENLPRVDYTDGTSSLLVEPQRRNLLEYSESISNLSSATNGTGTFTITDNYTDSPQGVQNASRVQMSIVDTDDTNNYRLISTGSVMINGVTREISFYAKSLTGLNQDVLVYWSYDQQIVTLTNDWQRFEISGTSANSGAVYIGARGGSGSYFSGGDANLDFALWGLQVEDDGSGGGSSYATSYIPTDGGTVTRVQETYTKTGISDLINSEEGVLFAEMAALADDSVSRKISLNSGTFANQITVSYGSGVSNRIQCIIYDGINVVVNMSYSSTNIIDFNKIAIKYISGNTSLWVNGVEVDTDNAAFSGLSLSALSFDNGSSTNFFYGKVKQLQVFKTALTDTELATLTQ